MTNSKLKVKLLNYTPNGEETIAEAGKLCYSRVGVDEISEKLDHESIEKYVKMLANMGHLSPIEHISFTFAVEGVSRVLSHQLVRHRLASYSQQSQRYVTLDQFDYIIPPEIEKNPRAREIFVKKMEEDQRAYDELTDILYQNHYEKFIGEGVDEAKAKKDANKRAIEDARYVFPNACETKLVFTMNARNLLHFFSLRSCLRAQWEIRELSDEMVKLVKGVYPNIFAKAGPSCIYGPCPEGKMTCGKINEVREKFNNI
ncbi:MAG: FAD-dependent thymidylate synthase [Anaerococcus sp.]|nr:FAD-dependent thymidylate synthase [Anaerococcus sp.]MDD7043916.1 FAD-dependent thymidylate synthase [Peptoniphilaceae bacterium]MDY2918694.1 FAD-dependent thymidylate synthase [Anaerococcus sp.]